MGQDTNGINPFDENSGLDENFDFNRALNRLVSSYDPVKSLNIETCRIEEIIEHWKTGMKVGDSVLAMDDIVYYYAKIDSIDETGYPRIFQLKGVYDEVRYCRSDIVPLKRFDFNSLDEEQYPVVTYLPNIQKYFKAILKKGESGKFEVFTPNREKGYPAEPTQVFLNVSEYLLKRKEYMLQAVTPEVPKNIIFDDEMGEVENPDDADLSKEEERILVGKYLKDLGMKHNDPVLTMRGCSSFNFQKGKLIFKNDEEGGGIERYYVEHYDLVKCFHTGSETPELITSELEPKDLRCGVVYLQRELLPEEGRRIGEKVLFETKGTYKEIVFYQEGIIYEDFRKKSVAHCLSVMGLERLVERSKIIPIPPNQLKRYTMNSKQITQRNNFKKILDSFETNELILSEFAEDSHINNSTSSKKFRTLSWYTPKIKLYKKNPYEALTQECERMKCKFYDPYFLVEDRYTLCSRYMHNSLRHQKCCAPRSFLWWKRLCRFKNKSYKFHFFTDDEPCDFNQSMCGLGNCSFLALFPFIDTNEKMSNLVSPPYLNPNGFYVFKLYNRKEKEFNFLVIDDYIPLKGRYVLHCSSIKNTFFSILEKATTKIWGSYMNTSGEYSSLFPDRAQVLSSLLFKCSGCGSFEHGGGPSHLKMLKWKDLISQSFLKIEHVEKVEEISPINQQQLLRFNNDETELMENVDAEDEEKRVCETLQGHRHLGDLLVLSGGDGENGIAKHHAYTLYSFHVFENVVKAKEEEEEEEEQEGEEEKEKERKTKTIRLARIRNPHGHAPWNGPWSQGSEEWKQYEAIKNELFSNSKSGWFFMSLKDMMKHFRGVKIYPSDSLEDILQKYK